MNDRQSPDDFTILRLQASYEAFGVVMDYLAGIEPFAQYAFGSFARAIQQQLHGGYHRAAVTRNRLVGYVGWLPSTERIAQKWQKGAGELTGVPAGQAPDTAALTVVAAADRRVLFALIAQVDKLNPYPRIFYKREYAAGRVARKGFVDIGSVALRS